MRSQSNFWKSQRFWDPRLLWDLYDCHGPFLNNCHCHFHCILSHRFILDLLLKHENEIEIKWRQNTYFISNLISLGLLHPRVVHPAYGCACLLVVVAGQSVHLCKQFCFTQFACQPAHTPGHNMLAKYLPEEEKNYLKLSARFATLSTFQHKPVQMSCNWLFEKKIQERKAHLSRSAYPRKIATTTRAAITPRVAFACKKSFVLRDAIFSY